jgi:hypothetical protein
MYFKKLTKWFRFDLHLRFNYISIGLDWFKHNKNSKYEQWCSYFHVPFIMFAVTYFPYGNYELTEGPFCDGE